jgi:hypothetical protein
MRPCGEERALKKSRFTKEQIASRRGIRTRTDAPKDAIRVGRQIVLEGEVFRGLEPF